MNLLTKGTVLMVFLLTVFENYGYSSEQKFIKTVQSVHGLDDSKDPLIRNTKTELSVYKSGAQTPTLQRLWFKHTKTFEISTIERPHHLMIKRATKTEKVLSNTLSGASIGASIGGYFGGGVGAVVGGVIGGLVGLVSCLFSCKDDKPPNKPPSFTSCPESGFTIYAMEGEVTAVVRWDLPVAKDPEDGNLGVTLVQGKSSGSSFVRGSHTIIYNAADSQGLTTHCYFSFEIKVITCPPIPWPSKGYVNCDGAEFIYGSYCTVQCFDGYEMVPSSIDNRKRIKCDSTSNYQPQLNSAIPVCEAITCPANSSALDPENGAAICTHNNYKYDSSCVTQCDPGYSLPTGFLFTTCQEDRTWSTSLTGCKDSEAPVILNCPSTVYTYSDRGGRSANVTWSEPTAQDNSGNASISQTMGPPRGSVFPLGLTEVRYRATDSEGNKSPDCIFFVSVEEIRCDPPYIVDKYLTYDCPGGYTFGSACNLRCMGNFPLIGNETITCESNNTVNPPEGYWDMGGSQPYCLKNPCDKLPAPVNGAMVCDTWMFGLQCQMQCSDKYDIPYGTVSSNGAPFTGLFTCSESKGLYTPSNTVPGCTKMRRPGMTTVLGEFFYYTGDCNDPTVVDEIKENFIKQMQKLEANGWNGVCPTQIECNVTNTDVTCGAVSGKKKKSISYESWKHEEKRSTHEIRVEITMTTTWYDFNSTGGDTFYFLEEIQQNMLNAIKAVSSSGNLTVRGLTPDVNSFQKGWSDPNCPMGHHIRWSTLTCVPCAPGTYLDTTVPTKPGCQNCPKGTYKEDPNDVVCTPCPVGTSTLTDGSMNRTDCLAKCNIGEFSGTGLEPCKPCPISTYQDNTMSTACVACPAGKSTQFTNSTSTSNCSDFDVLFTTRGDSVNFQNSGMESKELSVMTWLRVPDVKTKFILFGIQSAVVPLEIEYSNHLYITINSTKINTGIALSTSVWQHLTVMLETSSLRLSVFVNGLLNFTSTSLPVIQNSFIIDTYSTFQISLEESSITGYSLSGYQVETSFLSDSEVFDVAMHCHANRTNMFISMGDIGNSSLSGAKTIVPSVCDNINQCEPDPCNGHTCEDRVNSYKCHCSNGYNGDNCQNTPNYCAPAPCQNGGTCYNTGRNFTCSCANGFKGDKCEIQIVNGGWSEWSTYSDCSVTCGGGTQVRSRVCNSPPPDPDGMPCDVNQSNETIACNTDVCPSCTPLRGSFGNQVNCTRLDAYMVCEVSCRPGYTFVSGHLPALVYICGPNQSYEWNGRPPPCGRAYSPRSISAVTRIQYTPEVPCSEASAASQILKDSIEKSLQCAINNTCAVNVEVPDCTSSAGRKRRSTSDQVVTLGKTFQAGDNLNLEMYHASNNVSQPLYELATFVSDLEGSLSQINSTHSILQIDLNGTVYTSTAVTTTSIVDCPPGQGRASIICADCPTGTYSNAGFCTLCPIGRYQDEFGQTSCKDCPSGFSTNFKGSQNETECSVVVSTTLTSDMTTNTQSVPTTTSVTATTTTEYSISSTVPSTSSSPLGTTDTPETSSSYSTATSSVTTSSATETVTSDTMTSTSYSGSSTKSSTKSPSLSGAITSTTTTNWLHSSKHRHPRIKDDAVDISMIVAISAVLTMLVAFVIVSSILIYKQRIRAEIRNKPDKIGSWASKSMLRPDINGKTLYNPHISNKIVLSDYS